MLKKTIEYEDLFTGETVIEDLYFHLNQAEMVEIELSHKGGLSEAMKKIIATEDGDLIMSTFKDIILRSYGVRSPGGKFLKSRELREEFASSEAYSKLFMEIVTNTDAMVEFVVGVMPKEIAPEASRILEELEKDERKGQLTSVPKTYTRVDVMKMDSDQIAKLGEEMAAGTARVVDAPLIDSSKGA